LPVCETAAAAAAAGGAAESGSLPPCRSPYLT
jgi:hypothetical protein